MQVFDFDNTLYDGECSLDFFLFCVKKKKSLAVHVPKILSMAAKYKLKRVPKSEVADFVSEVLAIFFKNCENLEAVTEEFWKLHRRKLKKNMIKKIQAGDAVISASPDFLLNPMKDSLAPAELICTQVDMKNERIAFLCYGKNKIEAYKRRFGDTPPDVFYTDNKNDEPMMKFAKKYVVVR